MAIFASQLKLYLTGGASNADPTLSLGGTTSSVEFTNNTINNLFASIGPNDALNGAVHYRALTFKNTSALTAYESKIHIGTETTSADTTVAIAYDSTGTQSVADEDTAPAGLSFSTPLSLATAIDLGDVAAAGVRRIWFRRTVTAGAAAATGDSGVVIITVGSAP
jgi:hypothetical protein